MKAKHDSLGRRNRFTPTSTGKALRLTPRDIAWFHALHRHGPLTPTYLHEFTKGTEPSYQCTQRRLTDLFHEDNTPHGGTYLDRPLQQTQTLDPLANDLIYDNTDNANDVLRQEGRYSEYAPTPFGAWKHRFMVSSITAAIELECRSHNLAYIPQHAILERAGVPIGAQVPFINPVNGKREKKYIIPDAIFGIAYENPKRFLFFVVEADRGTEPLRAKNLDRKSYRRTILQYLSFIGGSRYKEHYNLQSGLLVLNITTSEARMNNLIDLTYKLSEGKGNSFMLFSYLPEFGVVFKPPKLMPELVTDVYTRAGKPDFSMLNPAI